MTVLLFLYLFLLVFIPYFYNSDKLEFKKDNYYYCNPEDLELHVSPCDNNNIRQVYMINKNSLSCYAFDDNKYFNKTILLPNFIELSQKDSNCKLTCKNSNIINYNISSNKLYCDHCPYNTYNYGGNFFVCGKSKELSVDLFQNRILNSSCVVLDYNLNEHKILDVFNTSNNIDNNVNSQCSYFNASSDSHAIVSGRISNENKLNKNNKTNKHYYGKLDFILEYEKDGQVC